MDNVRCPWCGSKMVIRDWQDIFFGKGNFFECVCGAKGPIKASPDTALAAMQRYVEPTGVALRTCGTCASWRPSELTNRVFCAYHSEDGHDYEIHADDYCSDWERRPTDAERSAAPWGNP